MRVLFVTHNIPRHDGDAAGSFVLQLAVALQDAGARISVIAPGGAGLSERETLRGVEIHRVRYASDDDMTLAYSGTMAERVRTSWRARWSLLGLLRALRQATQSALTLATRDGDPYDVVHVHWWFPSGLALWRAVPRPTPTVITMHGSDVRLAQHLLPARIVMRAVLRAATVRSAVSTWLAEIATRVTNGLDVHVAPMPVDATLFTDDSTDGDQSSRAGVLFVGRLNQQKGLSHLLQAMTRPALANGALTVAGDGTDATILRTMADTLGISARVRWLGVQTPSDLAVLYRAASVVAIPSVDEGLGLVAVEAQLCGAPVVAFASGGLLDVVRAEHGGTLVPVGDIDGLAAALGVCLRHPADAAARGRLARDGVRSRFTPARVAAVYLALYADAARAV